MDVDILGVELSVLPNNNLLRHWLTVFVMVFMLAFLPSRLCARRA